MPSAQRRRYTSRPALTFLGSDVSCRPFKHANRDSSESCSSASASTTRCAISSSNCAPRDKVYFDGSDPNATSGSIRAVEETYIGKMVDAGTPAASMEDLKRNILSILTRVAPGRHREDAIKVFALDEGEPPPLPGKDEPPPRARTATTETGHFFLAMREAVCLTNPALDAPVAQLDRASDFESAGRAFESPRAHRD